MLADRTVDRNQFVLDILRVRGFPDGAGILNLAQAG